MPTTVIGPLSDEKPTVYSAPILYIKQLWQDQWSMLGERLEFIEAEGVSGLTGAGSMTFLHRYGNVKTPSGTELVTRAPLDILDWWVRLVLVGGRGSETQWMGKIFSEPRTVHSVPASDPPVASDPPKSGVQTYVANGPKHLLNKKHISRSDWFVEPAPEDPPPDDPPPDSEFIEEDDVKNMGWLPSMNSRDDRNQLIGNRSTRKLAEIQKKPHLSTYVYGEGDVWTNAQYVSYLLSRFMEQSEQGGPTWILNDPTGVLGNLTDVIEWRTTQTVGEMLEKLIPRRMGLDFYIEPTNVLNTTEGFSVNVFALSAVERSFGETATMPSNPNLVSLDTAEFPDVVSATVVRTQAQQFDQINVIGERIVACCSIGNTPTNGEEIVERKWGASDDTTDPDLDELQEEYNKGRGEPEPGEDDPFTAEDHDLARRRGRYDTVYQAFGVGEFWDLQGGRCAVKLNDLGAVEDGGGADFQRSVRRTLPWIPMELGLDYSVDPPASTNEEGYTPGLRPLTVWLWDIKEQRYITAHKAGIGVSYARTDWGFQLSSNPNHLLAAREFAAGHFDVDVHKTARGNEPLYDWEDIIATIAFRTDQRVALKSDIPRDPDAPLGDVLNIEATGAELWYLAPGTAVDMEDDGTIQYSGGGGRVLRDDTPRMALIMAGALARYFSERTRATIVLRGLWSLGGLVGQILRVLQAGVDTQFIESPITSISWQVRGREPTTTIRAGYAG